MRELRTEAFTAERAWEVEGIPVLTAEVALPEPVPLADRVSRRIHRYYQTQCRAFLRYCESLLLPQAAAEYRTALAASSPLPEFRAELSYRVTYNQDGLWSLYTQSRERVGPGPELVTRRSDTWDLTEGYPVPLGDFLRRQCDKTLLPQGRGLEEASCHTGGGGNRAQNPGRDGGISPGMAEGGAAALQSPELLSDRGRAGVFLSHVRPCPRKSGRSHVHSTLQ